MKKTVLYLFLFLILQSVALLVVGVLLAVLKEVPLDFTIQGISNMLGSVDAIAYGTLFSSVLIIIVFGLFGWTKFDFKKSTPGGMPVIIGSVLFILSGAVVMNIITSYLELENKLTHLFIAMAHTIPGFLAVSLVGPIAEEMLFRGAIQRALHDKGYRPCIAIGISSLMFGLIHANPAQIPFGIALGIMFGWIYYRTNNLMPVILGHIANNTIACLLMVALPEESQWLNSLETPTWMITTLVGSLIATIALTLFLHKKMGDGA